MIFIFRVKPICMNYRLTFLLLIYSLLSTAQNSDLLDKYTSKVTAFQNVNEDSVLFYIGKIQGLAVSSGDETIEAIAQLTRGMHQDHYGSPDSALYYYRSAEETFQKTNNEYRLGIIYNNIGVVYNHTQQFDSSIFYHQKALPYAEKTDSSIYALSLFNIGNGYHLLGDREQSMEYFEKSLTVAEAIPSPKMILKCATGIASVNLFSNPKKSIEILERTLPQIEEELFGELHNAYNIVGGAYFLTGDPGGGLAYYKKGLSVALETNSAPSYVISLLNIGECLGALGQIEAAVDSLEKSRKISYQNGYGLYMLEGWKYELAVLEQENDYRRTLETFKKYQQTKDSINLEAQKKNIAELETKYQTELKERQIVEKNLEIASQEASIQSQRNQIISLISGLIIVLLFGSIFYIQFRNKQKAKLQSAIINEQEKGLEAVFAATEEERKRIAKDLHDGVGQQLSALKRGFEDILESMDPKVKLKAQQLKELVDETAEDTRSISHQIMPRALTELGLVPAIEDSLNKSLGSTTIQFEFEHFNLRNRYEERKEVAVYRILQELVNNVIKHSDAGHVSVQLFENQSNLILIVEDDGSGIGSTSADGIGLLNIKNRLNTFKGKVNLEPSTESGTTATISIPV